MQEMRDKEAETRHTLRQNNPKWWETHTGTDKMYIQPQKQTADTQSVNKGDGGTRQTSAMPANFGNNFLALISKGDGELRSWL